MCLCVLLAMMLCVIMLCVRHAQGTVFVCSLSTSVQARVVVCSLSTSVQERAFLCSRQVEAAARGKADAIDGDNILILLERRGELLRFQVWRHDQFDHLTTSGMAS